MLAYLPPQRPDQALTSWLLLLCRNHGATPHSFGQLLWPGISIWTRDFDRTVSDKTLEAISTVTGVSVRVLSSMTLRDMIRRSNQAIRANGKQAGILPIGVYHRVRTAHGQQYCPACLDQTSPYLKLEWRSEFAVACRDHLILLRDACPHCDAPFVPHRNKSLVLAKCHRCLGKLTCGSTTSAPKPTLRLQSTIAFALGLSCTSGSDHGRIAWGAFTLSDGELLDGVRRLCRLQASVQRRAASQRGRKEWSLLRIGERADVMNGVANALANWPSVWIEWAKANDLTQNALTTGFGSWPQWIRDAMSQLPASFGPIGVRRARDVAPLRLLRRQAPTLLAYRCGRAKLLLREAMCVKDALA